MATASLAQNRCCCCHVSNPEKSLQQQIKHPKKTKSLGLVPRTTTTASSPVQRQRPKASPGAVIRPNSLTRTRALRRFIERGSISGALYLFEKMHHADTFIWNAVIRGFANHGMFKEAIEFYKRMEFEGVRSDHLTFPFVIKACGEMADLVEGQKMHAKLIKVGVGSDVYVCNFVSDMYVKFGLIELAEKVFRGMRVRDLVSWNSMLSGYLAVGDGLSSLMCFREMMNTGEKFDRFSVISILGACSDEHCLQIGKEIHCQVLRSGLEVDVMIQTSLVDMYGKCCKVDYAERVFNRILKKNIVVWNAVIGGYALNAHFSESFACLKRMQDEDSLIPDAITMINLLPSCGQQRALVAGKSIHGYAVRHLFLPHVVLETALIDMYGECKELKLAEHVFFEMNERNLVSWNSMVGTYVQNERNREALELFQDIWNLPLNPDAITCASILPAYAELASTRECKQIHAYIRKLELGSNNFISNAIIYMYAKCADLNTARKVFDEIACKSVVSWNTMMMAYAIHGFGKTSIQLFSEMREKGIEPNASTFASLLLSCSISGLVEEGWEYFNLMKVEYLIDPGIEHFGCMVDLLGRTGNLDAAKQFIEEMPLLPTARIWGSLLAASRKYNDIASAELAAKHILSLEHDNTGGYILLSNMYAAAGKWEDVHRIKFLMAEKGLARTTGRCMVETNGGSHSFVNLDKSHIQTSLIYGVLDIILEKIGEDVYVHSHSKFRRLDLVKKRENSPKYHSVKLAICYSLISTAIGSPVVVRKNTRICDDCHSAAKKISQVTRRELVVCDSYIFHHFRDGRCSCGDYW